MNLRELAVAVGGGESARCRTLGGLDTDVGETADEE